MNGNVSEDAVQQARAEAIAAQWLDVKGRPIGDGWVKTRAKSREIDQRRKEACESRHLHELAVDPEHLRNSKILQRIQDPARLFEAYELSMLVHRLLDELKPPRRRKILSWFCEGKTFVEIGKRLGLSEDAVRCQKEAALEALRVKLLADGRLDILREYLS